MVKKRKVSHWFWNWETVITVKKCSHKTVCEKSRDDIRKWEKIHEEGEEKPTTKLHWQCDWRRICNKKLSKLWLNTKSKDVQKRSAGGAASNECVTKCNRFNANQIEIKTTRKQPNKFIFIFSSLHNYLLLAYRGSLDMRHLDWSWLTVWLAGCLSACLLA